VAVHVLLAGVAAAAAQQAEGHNGEGQQAAHGDELNHPRLWRVGGGRHICLGSVMPALDVGAGHRWHPRFHGNSSDSSPRGAAQGDRRLVSSLEAISSERSATHRGSISG